MLRPSCIAIATTMSSSHSAMLMFQNEVEGKPPVDLKLSDGETRFVAGNFAQVAKHLSDQPFRNATIALTQDERLRQTPSHWPEENGEKTSPGPQQRRFRYALLINGFPGETKPTRCSLAVRRSLSMEADAAARRLRSFATFSARVRRRRISGRRLGADIRSPLVFNAGVRD